MPCWFIFWHWILLKSAHSTQESVSAAIFSPALVRSIKDEPTFYYGSSDHNKLCSVKINLTLSSHSTSQSERIPVDTPSIVWSSLFSNSLNRSWKCAGNFHRGGFTPNGQMSSYQIVLSEPVDQVNAYEFAIMSLFYLTNSRVDRVAKL